MGAPASRRTAEKPERQPYSPSAAPSLALICPLVAKTQMLPSQKDIKREEKKFLTAQTGTQLFIPVEKENL